MEDFKLILPWEFFRGVRNGKITALIYDHDILQGIKRGEIIEICCSQDKVKMYFISSKIVPFKNITDEDAKECGFLNRDLLARYLMDKYNIDIFFTGNYPDSFDKYLFCLIYINESPLELSGRKKIVNSLTAGYNIRYYDYNAEYDDEPWRII